MRLSTLIHKREGTENLSATVAEVAKVARKEEIEAIIVFTSLGNGAMMLSEFVDESIKITAVTFPFGTTAESGDERVVLGIPHDERRSELASRNIAIVQGTMPFRGLDDSRGPESINYIRRTLEMFGGSMSLCVQSVLMACDSGALAPGTRCIAMTADTAAIIRSEHSHRFASASSAFAVEHVICKPLLYSVTRPTIAVGERSRPRSVARISQVREIESNEVDQGSTSQ